MKGSISTPKLPEFQLCTGCRACNDICPKRAIVIKTDKYGFFYPEIDENICIKCGKCEMTCPIQSPPKFVNEIREAYLGRNKNEDVVFQSSSGGAFSAIISAWKADSVCGVRWDGFKAVNDIGRTSDEIQKFSKSKYILSNTNNIYIRAAEELKLGKKIVFSGTPCQVAAFKNIIGDNNNVLFIDIVCHGAPSSLFLEMHLKELEAKKGKKLKQWTFRDKTKIDGKISSRSARIDYLDGTWEHFEINQDAFLQMYYNRIAYRESCGNCIFAKPDRISDITICDAHHIEELYPDMSVEKGASAILIHSKKGEEVLPEIKKRMIFYKVDYDWAVEHNKQLIEPTSLHPKTNLFYQAIDSGIEFEKAVSMATHRSLFERAIGFIKRKI